MENPVLAILTATDDFLGSQQWTQMAMAGNAEVWSDKESANFEYYDVNRGKTGYLPNGAPVTGGKLQQDLDLINYWASQPPSTTSTAELNAAQSEFNYDSTECSTINNEYNGIMSSATTLLGNIMSSLMQRVMQIFQVSTTIENALGSAIQTACLKSIIIVNYFINLIKRD